MYGCIDKVALSVFAMYVYLCLSGHVYIQYCMCQVSNISVFVYAGLCLNICVYVTAHV